MLINGGIRIEGLNWALIDYSAWIKCFVVFFRLFHWQFWGYHSDDMSPVMKAMFSPWIFLHNRGPACSEVNVTNWEKWFWLFWKLIRNKIILHRGLNKKGLQKLVCTAVLQRGPPPHPQSPSATEPHDSRPRPFQITRRDVIWMREEGGRIQVCGGRAAEAPAQPETLPVYYSAPRESATRAGQSNWTASRTHRTLSVRQHKHSSTDRHFLSFQSFQLKPDLTSCLTHIWHDIKRAVNYI